MSLTVGAPLILTTFTLLARLNPSYSVTIPVLFIGATITSALVSIFICSKNRGYIDWDIRADIAILGINSLLLLSALGIRSNWPSIFWDNINNHHGVEKLFNFSMIQAFIFGRGFPPENLWNLGQPIDYYILLHTLPGLTAWGWRILTGDPSSGGILFVFSDTFLLIWGSLALTAWGYTLLCRFSPTLTRRQSLSLAIILGVGVLLSVHVSAVLRILVEWFGGAPYGGWKRLQDFVVSWTVAQYPLWTLLLGDHHAFQRVYSLQVTLISSLILLLGATRFHLPRIFLVSGLASSVLLAHPGSVMIDLIVSVPAILAIVIVLTKKQEWTALFTLTLNIAAAALLTGLFSLPRLLEVQPAVTDWYWVETTIASPLAGFLSVQFAPLLFLGLFASSVLFTAKRTLGRVWVWIASMSLLIISAFGLKSPPLLSLGLILSSGLLLWPTRPFDKTKFLQRCSLVIPRVAGFSAIVALILVGRPAAAVALSCIILVLVSAPRATIHTLPLIAIGSSLFFIWLLPEFVVVESPVFGNGPGKRFNVTMRFWLEGYYLVPFLALIIWSPLYPAILERKLPRRVYSSIICLVATFWMLTHGRAIADRIKTTGDEPQLNGATILSRISPKDAAIVTYLQHIPGIVHLGELCGTGEIIKNLPTHYDWPGRIAAFSARPGLCGWTQHIWQIGTRLRNPTLTGSWSWVRFREYERELQQAYTAALTKSFAPQSREFFKKLGITHLVVGEKEQKIFPTLQVNSLANAIGGKIVFLGNEGTGVIALEGL